MRNARTAATPLVVAHDIPPLGPVHVAVAVGKGRIALIDKSVVPNSQNVPYLVCDRHGRGGARVMHDKKGFIRIRAHPGRKAAALWVVDDQTDDVGMLFV